MELVGTLATFVAVFALLMAVFGPSLFPPPRVEAVRAAALPRHRFERLVSAERPWWERLVSPLAGRIALRLPALARQVDESLIVRAGLDPAILTPAEVYAAKLVAAGAVLALGGALTPLFGAALLLALVPAFVAQVRRVGVGIPQALEAAERGLREDERNRLLGAASTVQPKLAAILAGIYLPEFLLLILVPMFISTLGRL